MQRERNLVYTHAGSEDSAIISLLYPFIFHFAVDKLDIKHVGCWGTFII